MPINKHPKITAVVNTKNEAKNLERCLTSLNFVDEIVVVDMRSTDDTKKIAKRYTNHIYDHEDTGFVEPARNFAIGKATGHWILVIDADETVTPNLADKLRQITENDEADYVEIPRKNMIFGRWIEHSGWWPDYNIRFFKKGAVTWQNQIHSVPLAEGKKLSLAPMEEFSLVHHHYISIDEYLTRMLRYTNTQAQELIDAGYSFSFFDVFNKPFSEFLSRYFAAQGYKDGFHGLVLALLQSFSFFIVYLKLWQHAGFPEQAEITTSGDWQKLFASKFLELKYWIYTVRIHLTSSKLKKNLLKIKRRFKL